MKYIAQLGIKGIVIVLTVLFILNFGWSGSVVQGSTSQSDTNVQVQSNTWIIKWKSIQDPAFEAESEIVQHYPSNHTVVAKPRSGLDEQAWVKRWKDAASVDYINRNQEVRISARPNDPLRERQKYLKQIHAEEAWDVASENSSIIIAIVDTGVDLEHPDLEGNLVPGMNIINPELPPKDDNGHGTNVAGIIAATSHNHRGVAGLLWKARIMPIKALDANGRGDEARLAEGIRYAVDHGAKIVVLSVGLLVNDLYLAEIVKYAEEHGVLLVAASGNDEGDTVRYPAAYPTVLAVGGVASDNRVEERSNFGPEIDVVAPWSVYTTAIGSRYEAKDGTSVAAPQAAAVAGLVWSKYPDMKPYEIRNLLRQTAEDVGSPGWDKYTGYGLLRADQALLQQPQSDIYENNDNINNAKPLPMNHTIFAEISNAEDRDWYYIESPYDGVIDLRITFRDTEETLTARYYEHTNSAGSTFTMSDQESVQIHVSKGKHYVRITPTSASSTIAYQLTVQFDIYRDGFEDNDKQYKAYVLPQRSQTIVGTFHQRNDQDWFVYHVAQSGTLQLSLSANTGRIDPILLVQKKGEKSITYDDQGAGESEQIQSFEVLPGAYYLRVTQVSDSPITGEYQLQIEFTAKHVDPNEPNNKPYQAIRMQAESDYVGVFDDSADTDWFSFKLDDRSIANVTLSNIPRDRYITATIMDNNLNRFQSGANDLGDTQISITEELAPGTYYVQLEANESFEDQLYHIQFDADPLIAGFSDIHNHWAKEQIQQFIEKGWVDGYGHYTFSPDNSITREEATAILVRAMRYSKQKSIPFADVSESDWSYPYIAKAMQAGVVQGYPDGNFRPSQSLTRMEMAVLIAKALNFRGKIKGNAPFTDIAEDHWGTAILKQLKAEGLIEGYADRTFKPNQSASRAEFISILSHALLR